MPKLPVYKDPNAPTKPATKTSLVYEPILGAPDGKDSPIHQTTASLRALLSDRCFPPDMSVFVEKKRWT